VNKKILHQAISLLSRREHSLKELRQKLVQREYERDELTPVLDFLICEDYQSDLRAADCFFRNRVSRGYGWLYIQNELKQKGIANDVMYSVYHEQDIDWYEQVQNTYQKKFADMPIVDQKDKAKRFRFLQYRGFSLDEIYFVLNES